MDKKTFRDIWVDMNPDEKRALADQAETSVAYLSQIAHDHGTPSGRFAKSLAVEIGGGATRESLFPHLFQKAAA